MRGIFRAIARALRAVMRRLRATAAWGAGLVDGAWASMFGGGGYVEEMEFDDAPAGGGGLVDQRDLEAERQAEALARQVPDHTPSPALLVRRAVELRSANLPYAGVFDLTHPEQKRLHAFVQALDESGMRAVRCMPIGTLERHLDSSPFCAVGLRPIDRQIALAREEAEAKAAAIEAKASPDRRRRRRETPVTDALSSGRRMSLQDLVDTNRRRVPA